MTYRSGYMDARIEGREEGALSNAIESVRNLMNNFKLTAQAAMDAIGTSPADRPSILAAL